MTRPNKSRPDSVGLWRRKKAVSDEDNQTMMVDLVDYIDSEDKSASSASLLDEVKEFASTDAFQREVAKKTQTMLIGRKEAELEVFTDILIDKLDGVDAALLYVVTNVKSQTKAQTLVNNLICRGANTSTSDVKLKTPLHYAVEKKFKGVAAKLLEHHALAHARDRDKNLPLHIAIETGQDEMSALLLAYMPNTFVRKLFIGENDTDAECSFTELIRRSDLQKTVSSVLDCMIETDDSGDDIKVYYNILESDQHGRPPNDPKFDGEDRSPLHIIAKQGNKNIVYHDVVRLLIRRKWKHYAKKRFELVSFLYMLTLFCLTFSGIVAAMTQNPLHYDTPLQLARAVFEIASVCMALQLLISELNQFKRHRLEYFMEAFNWLDFSSAILILCVIPLRYTENKAQWQVFAFGYLFWVIRIFKYAAVFRQTGAYAQVLFRILSHDFIQFGAVFLVILLAFSGAFFLSLRGDDDLDTHSETSTFWGILYVGVRTLTEAQPVVEYSGDDGYGTVSAILMLCFLFTCYVILLNILIAQLTDTYQNVQQDAHRGLEVNRAWIVARTELNSFFFGQDFRKKHYVEFEEVRDLKNVLTKWDNPPINEMNKNIRDIWDSLDDQKMNILTVQHRLARQENALRGIQAGLERLIQLQTGDSQQTNTMSSSAVTFTLNSVRESDSHQRQHESDNTRTELDSGSSQRQMESDISRTQLESNNRLSQTTYGSSKKQQSQSSRTSNNNAQENTEGTHPSHESLSINLSAANVTGDRNDKL